MTPIRLVCAAAGLAASFAAAGDALATLDDAALFAKAQKDVAEMPRTELDALTDAVATCSAVSVGQRAQQFECERGVYRYWTRYSRGRSIDDYVSALGGLFAAFDNNALNPTPAMMQTYRHTSNDLVTLTKAINKRYRQTEK